jgi:hypothetical protein
MGAAKLQVIPGGLMTAECAAIQELIENRNYWEEAAAISSRKHDEAITALRIATQALEKHKHDPLRTVEWAAEFLGVSTRTVVRRQKELGFFHIEGNDLLRTRQSYVEAFINNSDPKTRKPKK